MMKYCAVPLRPTQEVNHILVCSIHAMHARHPKVTE